MKSDRVFYTSAAGVNLLIMAVGFWPYYTAGRGEGGRVIDPALVPTVFVHGMSITAWYGFSLLQSLLIAVKKRRVHLMLGWVAVALAPVIAVSGALVAVRSARAAPPAMVFFGMPYRSDFVLVMLTEVTVFTACVMTGLLTRKRPEVHRAMMLSASLSLLLGATTRIPWLLAFYGGDGSPVGFFGPVFTLGLLLLLVNSLRRRAFDRWFATALGGTITLYLSAMVLGATGAWHQIAATLLRT